MGACVINLMDEESKSCKVFVLLLFSDKKSQDDLKAGSACALLHAYKM